MRLFHLKRKQFLPVTLDEAWRFFSSPYNLARITPPSMNFKIVYISGDGNQVYPGQIIQYRIRLFPGVVVDWVTEITHVNKPDFFVDEQRFGPYRLWHHQHHFEKVPGGIEMTDEVNYAIPFGWIGVLVHNLVVRHRVDDIFDYRYAVLQQVFNTPDSSIFGKEP